MWGVARAGAGMGEAIVDLVGQAVYSPWVYAALFVLAAIDSFLPLVPSETAVITAGVFAVSGEPDVFLVIAAAALGAFAGDHMSYFGGRYTAGRWMRWRGRRRGGRRRRAAVEWAVNGLSRRGGLILLVARFVPGGRTAVTVSTGAVGYPLRRFSFFDAVGALSWAVYCTMIGYLGGKAFEDNPLAGLLLGLGVALSVTVLTEVVRLVRRHRRTDAEPARPGRDDGRVQVR